MRRSVLGQMDLNLLVYLDLLVREQSVTQAALAAGITQSAMSRALQRLREQLGDPILVQVGRSLQATRRAERLRPIVSDVLAKIRSDILAPERFDPATSRRAFTLAGPDFVDALVAGPLASELCRTAPGVQLRFAGMGPAVRGDIVNGELDVLIGFPPGDRANLKMRRLFRDELVCIMRGDHPLAAKRLTLAAYLRYPHVLVTPGGRPGSIIDRELKERGKSRSVAIRSHSFLLAAELVGETDYVLALPRSLARHVSKRLGLLVKKLPLVVPSITLSMVWHTRAHRDPAHAWLRTRIASVAGALAS